MKRRTPCPYANYFRIGNNAFEFLFEFGQEKDKIHSRVYVTPLHARMFSELLQQTLKQYERAELNPPAPARAS